MSAPKTATSIRLSTAHGLQPLSKWRAQEVSRKWFALQPAVRRRNIWSQGAQLPAQCKVVHNTLRSASNWHQPHPPAEVVKLLRWDECHLPGNQEGSHSR